MARNYVFHVDVEDVNILTVKEIKNMYGAFRGMTRKKEIVDYLTSKLKSIVGDKIVLKKWDKDYATGKSKEYPNFDYETTEKLKNICDWWCGVDNMMVYFKKEEYAKEYVDWMRARGKEVKLIHLNYVVE